MAKNQLVSFSKRRTALIRKAAELCAKCDAEAAVLVVSQSGNTFSFGHSSVDQILRRYADRSSSSAAASRDWKKKATELQALRARVRVRARNQQKCDSVGDLEKTKAKYLNLLHKIQRKLAQQNDASSSSGAQQNDVVSSIPSSSSGGSGAQEYDVPFSVVNCDNIVGNGNDIWDDICLDLSSCNDTNFQLDDHQNYMSFSYREPSQQLLNDIDIADYDFQFTS